MIYVTKSSLPEFDEYAAEIRDIWESHRLTNMGPKYEQLREKLGELLSAEQIELVSNGHMAIELALQALELKGEVITTPFTFSSTTHAIVHCGLTPVFCDIDPVNCTMDPDKIEQLITPETTAILPVHVYGQICNIERIAQIAKEHHLKVIYDAAHAVGETYKGKGLGAYGDLSTFSFHATKVFSTCEGGGVSCNSVKVKERLYTLQNFGINMDAEVVDIGLNSKMSEFHAAMGLCNLRHLGEMIKERKKRVELYRENLKGCPGIEMLKEQEHVVSNFAYFPIFIHKEEIGMDRDQVCALLYEKGYFARKYFYPPTNEFPCYQGKFPIQETPIAHEKSLQVMTLPLYPDLEEEHIMEICRILKSLETE
ncbi:MAG: DegT/DnrJ/EryC1/StrS family aminotransferase [Lachnospiraceae bacterium]|nr:DegT/DnrJ/EryC1/StrS family aminotransferase [Lachnospiraceae bacterium]